MGPVEWIVDGRSDTFCHAGCTANEWFKLDLESEYEIASVKIYNRPATSDSEAAIWGFPPGHNSFERFQGSEIRVGNVNSFNGNPTCASNLPGDAVITVTCGAKGRYVFVVQPRSDTCLHIAEIEVFTCSGTTTAPPNPTTTPPPPANAVATAATTPPPKTTTTAPPNPTTPPPTTTRMRPCWPSDPSCVSLLLRPAASSDFGASVSIGAGFAVVGAPSANVAFVYRTALRYKLIPRRGAAK
jgi:hypothetical protein